MKTFFKWYKRVVLSVFLLLVVAIAAVKALAPSYEDMHGHPYPEPPPEGVNDEFLEVGSHHGKLAAGTLTWESSLANNRFGFEEDHMLVFAEPLASDAEIVDIDPAEMVPVRNEDGQITALELPADVSYQAWFHLVVRQPFDEREMLSPPLVAGRAIQQVTLEGLRYKPHRDGAIERYPGYFAQKGLTDEQVEWADGRLDDPVESTGQPIFVRPDQGFFDRGRLAGEVVQESAHRRERLIYLAGGFAAAVIAIGMVFQMLSTRARHEEADAFLSDLDRLD